MTDYLKSNYIIEEKVRIQEIPAIIFRPKEINKPIPTIIFIMAGVRIKKPSE